MLIYKDNRKLLLQYIAIFIATWQIPFKNVAQGVQSFISEETFIIKNKQAQTSFRLQQFFSFPSFYHLYKAKYNQT